MLVMDSDYRISSKVRSSPKKGLNSGWQPVRGWWPPSYQRQDGTNNIICFSANLQLQGWSTWYIGSYDDDKPGLYKQVDCLVVSFKGNGKNKCQFTKWLCAGLFFANPKDFLATWLISWWVTACGPTLDLGQWWKYKFCLYSSMQWWLFIFFFSKLGIMSIVYSTFSLLVSYLSYITLNSQ